MTRSEIIQTAINQYNSQVEFLSEDANLMVGTGFETNFRCQAEYSKTILEILTAELEREKNPLTCEGCEWQPKMMGVTRCQRCARFPLLTDRYEPKGEKV